jgi:3-hydroxyisobutyrate dehydrogenase
MRFGYIGLGNMGGAIAKRMILKHDIIVFDLSDKLMEDFSKLGAVPATSIAEVGGSADVIFFMLTHFK